VAVSVERLITSDILKSARYLGNERLAVNKPWDSAVICWVLTYPELYEELLRGVHTVWEQGWDKIKLYFMIGLPGKTDDDVLGIVETVHWLKRECWAQGRKSLSFNLTISNFTPKPHTPFQWHSLSTTEFQRKQNLLKQEFRQMRSVKVNFTDASISAMEDFIGRGSRSFGKILLWAGELGAGMDAGYDNLDSTFTAWGLAIACPISGVILRPEQILSMLKVAEKAEFHLLHIHRQRLVLGI